ncbi:DNA-binding protein [Secundilactobacillus pentosiphilus]|uniref:DNA-binding protein n=1 Tax=Secundilactobacillus pentosiphilus TaxID=1714682 RepID=A0A1Z5IVI1_9LACO|nr:YceD family protein [Secundilactobacillus pentosiphilus]GAX05800.1 DNA-binding protein [Secundilactobacillus pentosiphilus]
MKLSLSELQKEYRQAPLKFDEALDLKADLMERYPDEVLDVTPVHINGMVSVEGNGDALFYAHVKATLTVPSTRSLAPVELPADFDVTEFYVDSQAALSRYEKTDVVLVVNNDEIDVDKAIADNLLLQIPMQVLTKAEQSADQLPEGQGWEVTIEGDQDAEESDSKTVDPRLAKLKNFFDDSSKGDEK